MRELKDFYACDTFSESLGSSFFLSPRLPRKKWPLRCGIAANFVWAPYKNRAPRDPTLAPHPPNAKHRAKPFRRIYKKGESAEGLWEGPRKTCLVVRFALIRVYLSICAVPIQFELAIDWISTNLRRSGFNTEWQFSWWLFRMMSAAGRLGGCNYLRRL